VSIHRVCVLLLLSTALVFAQNNGGRGGNNLIQPLADLQKELKGKLERITVHGKSLEGNLEGDSADRDDCNTCWNGCSDEGCPDPIDEKNNAICTGVPSTWHCKARFYNDGFCDCGCGAVDYDCDPDAGVAGCESCNLEGSCSRRDCDGTIDDSNIAFCTHPSPPPEWKCSSYRYADGFTCDCGCGAIDPMPW